MVCATSYTAIHDLPSEMVTWIGDVETQSFDHHGRLFHSFNHEVTVTIPDGAVPPGEEAELKFAATFCAPLKFAPKTVPISVIVWLHVNVKLLKPITLCLPHFARVENRSHVNSLYFAKMTDASTSEGYMNVIDSGEFNTGEAFGLLDVDDSSYYCIVHSATVKGDVPENRYMIVVMKQKVPDEGHWDCDVCILPAIPTCLKVIFIRTMDCFELEIVSV